MIRIRAQIVPAARQLAGGVLHALDGLERLRGARKSVTGIRARPGGVGGSHTRLVAHVARHAGGGAAAQEVAGVCGPAGG